MAEKKVTAPPKLLTATRTGPSAIATTWENIVSTGATYTQISFFVRPKGSGTWRQATKIDTASQINAKAYTVTSIAGVVLDPLVDYEVHLVAYGPAGLSAPSNAVAGEVWFQAPSAPTVSAVTRTAVSTIRVTWENNVTARRPYTVIAFQLRPRTATGQWRQATQITTAAQINAGTYGVTSIGGNPLDGVTDYDVRLVAYNTAGSATTGSSSAGAWYQTPPGVTNLVGQRVSPTDPRIDIDWEVPTTTPRNRPTGQVLTWSVTGSGTWKKVPLGAAARTWMLIARPELGYTIRVATRNETGESTQLAEIKVAAQISPPGALAAPTAVLQPDGRVKIDWVASPPADKPITATAIWEQTQRGPARSVTSVAGSERSHLRTLPGNTIAKFAVLPSNAAGPAAELSPYSAEVVTRPNGAVSVTATRSGSSGELTIRQRNAPTDEPTIATSWEIQHSTDANAATSPNSATWFGVGAPAVTTALTTSWQHASIAGGVPHTYRVRPNRAGYTPTGADWVYSNMLPAYAPPLAPTVYAPDSMDPSEVLAVPVAHNPVDFTAQTGIAWRRRKLGGAWVYGSGTTATVATIPAGAYAVGDQVEVQVQTKGAAAAYGPYSPSLVITMRARPPVSIDAPTVSPAGPSTELAWSTPVQTAWRATVTAGGATILAMSGRDQTGRIPVDGLVDGTVHLFTVEVFDGYQWSKPATRSLTTAFIVPPAPTLAVVPDPAMATADMTVRPVEQYRVTRINYAAKMRDWDTNAPARMDGVLVRPDGSEQRAAILPIVMPISDPADPWFADMPRIYTGANLPAGMSEMSITVSSDYGASAQLFYRSTDLVPVGEVSIPAWPAVTRVTVLVSMSSAGGVVFSLVGQLPDEGTIYAYDPLWTAGTAGPDTGQGPFDDESTRPGYAYGWRGPTFGGYWEAVEGVGETSHAPLQVGDTVLTEPTSATRAQYSRRDPALGAAWEDLGVTDAGWKLRHLLPALGVPIWYRGGADSEHGGTAWGPSVEVVIDSDEVWVNFGDDHLDAVHGGYNPKLSATAPGPIVVRKRYAGHDVDVLSWGSRRARSVQAAVEVVPGEHGSTRQDWLRAAEHPGTVIYRDPDGEWLEGQLSDVSWGGSSSLVQQVGLTVTEGRG